MDGIVSHFDIVKKHAQFPLYNEVRFIRVLNFFQRSTLHPDKENPKYRSSFKKSRKESSMRERERERADSSPVLSLGGLKA